MNEWSDSDFDDYLESLPHRQSCCCPGCGQHPEIQGHTAECPPHRWLPDFGYCINEITGVVIAVDRDVVDANRAEDRLCEQHGVRRPRYDFEEALQGKYRPTNPNGQVEPTGWVDPKTGEVLPQAPPKLMAAQLAGIARKVAETPEGERNSILHWAYRRLIEQGHPPQAWNVVAAAARTTGLPDHEICSTLRWGRGVAS
jgi:hypothetical protein